MAKITHKNDIKGNTSNYDNIDVISERNEAIGLHWTGGDTKKIAQVLVF